MQCAPLPKFVKYIYLLTYENYLWGADWWPSMLSGSAAAMLFPHAFVIYLCWRSLGVQWTVYLDNIVQLHFESNW